MKSLFVILLFVSSTVHAGYETGNGGDGVYCSTSNSLELLDHYEAKMLRGIDVDLGAASLSVSGKLKIAIERVASFDLSRAQRYRKGIAKFFSEARFLSGINLVDIPDSAHIGVPVNCAIRQIAIQKEPQFLGDPVYVIDQDLWDLLSNDGRAGLILHEIIYREAISQGHHNSIASRYFNSLISSTRLVGLNHAHYRELLKVLQLPYLFAWRDLKSQLTWIEAEEFGRDLDCRKYGARLPSYSEVETAFPHLGEQLFTQGVVQNDGSHRDWVTFYMGTEEDSSYYYYYYLSRYKIEAEAGGLENLSWRNMGVCVY